MTGPLPQPVTLVWLALIGATAVLFLLADSADATRATTAAIVLIAAFKIRLVFLHFMELAAGAMPWRALAEGWVLLVTGVILLFFLTTSG